MATGGDEQVGYSLANVGTVTLENANETPDYYFIVICQNKIIVVDNNDDKVKIHRLHDGKFLDMLDSDSSPSNICLMDATTICVLHEDGLIEMASIKSENMSPVFTRMKSFRLDGVFDDYHSVVRVQDNIIVVGEKQDTTYWCIVSLDDGHVDTIHRISKKSEWSSVTTKDNIIYVLCYAGVADDNTGVYAFDILNPSQCKYKYKHKHLRYVTSIVINEDGNIFVGNYGVRDNSSIHQLTASCQLVAIFTEGIPRGLYAMFWDKGRLYVAYWGSHDITVFRHVYQGSHKESEVLVSDERKLPGIEESAIHISQGNVDNGQSSVETEKPKSGPSPEDFEDEKQGNLTDSEVSISDEGKQPVIEGISTQIGQEMVGIGQSSVKTETPPSGTSPEDSEDEKQGKHTDSEVPFSDEGKHLVIEGTSTQIGQEIPIEQSVEENLNQAEIKMSKEERDLFIKFQKEIGTDIYFSKGPHRLMDGQEALKATEIFIEQKRPDMKDKWLEYKSQGILTPELIGSHKESKVLVSDERKLPGIEESAIHISQGNVDNGQSSVETETPKSGPSPEDFEDEKQGNLTDSEVSISDEGKQPVIEGISTQIGQEMVGIGQSSVKTETPPSGTSPEDSEDEKQGKHTDSEVSFSDEGKHLVIEGTSTQIGQEIPIEQSVEENLNQAGIKMSTEERDLFIKFQKEIGTDIYFSKGPHRLIDGQETLKATETFIEQSRPDMKEKWLEYKSQGKLTHELIDVIYSEERNPELHNKKDEILGQMEVLNIMVKARSFDENGVKEDNYYFAPCMLHLESSREFVAPEQDPRLLSTAVLCWFFPGTFVPASIFDGLLAACLARWPVAKNKDTSEHLISPGSAFFELDLTHRLTLNFDNHDIFATVSSSVLDDINTLDAKLCTRVRMFISRKLSKITNSLKYNLKYELCVQSKESQDVSKDNRIRFSPFQIWFEDEILYPESPIQREHMNYARLCIALATVCGNALREMLLDHFPVPYRDIYQAILANQDRLIGVQGRPLLNQEQINLVFIGPLGQRIGTVETFDLSLLYTLIRNVSTVNAPSTGWGNDPQPLDKSLGASVERIRSYRNRISGHSPDTKISDSKFKDYWKKFKDVLDAIEAVINRNVYSKDLEKQKRQVISIFEAF